MFLQNKCFEYPKTVLIALIFIFTYLFGKEGTLPRILSWCNSNKIKYIYFDVKQFFYCFSWVIIKKNFFQRQFDRSAYLTDALI